MGQHFDTLSKANPGDLIQLPGFLSLPETGVDFLVAKSEKKNDGGYMLLGDLYLFDIRLMTIGVKATKHGCSVHKLK